MKIKNLFLALFALPLLFVACEKENQGVDEVKDPTVVVTAGEATESTIAFTVESTEAQKVAYIVVEGTEVPTASEVLANGTEIAANKAVALTATELKAETEYTIVAAAQNTKTVVKASATKTTLKAGEGPMPDYLTLKSASEMSFSADGGNGEIEYEIANPVDGEKVSATADVAWITDVAVSEKVTFVVAANDGAARSGKITVSYYGESFDVTVKQAASSETPAPEAWVASHYWADYDDSEGIGIYAVMLGDKEFGNSGWGVDGGTYYTLYFISASKGNGKLPNGTYVLDGSYTAGTIIVDYSYRHTMENGQLKYGMEIFNEANLIISNGKIEFNAVMERDGSVVKVIYEGDLSVDDGTAQQPSDFEATHEATKWLWGGSSSWGNKYQVVGENFSLDVHLQTTNATETSIVNGEYTWTSTTFWGYNDFEEFATRTFTVDGVSVAVDGGSLNVTSEGEQYHIEMTLYGRDGFTYMIEYNGKLNEKDEVGNDDMIITALGTGAHNDSYGFYTYKGEGGNFTFDLIVNDRQSKDNAIEAGTYSYSPMGKSFAGNEGYFFIDKFKIDGVTYKPMISSTMVVEGDGTNVGITLNLYMETGEDLVVTYNGTIGD